MTRHVRLRGHHLFCLHFYRGEGYDSRYVENLLDVVEALHDATIEVVGGADDICSACPDLRNGACASAEVGEVAAARLDGFALGLLHVAEGDIVVWAAIKERLPDAMLSWRQGACGGCDWRGICTPVMDLQPR